MSRRLHCDGCQTVIPPRATRYRLTTHRLLFGLLGDNSRDFCRACWKAARQAITTRAETAAAGTAEPQPAPAGGSSE